MTLSGGAWTFSNLSSANSPTTGVNLVNLNEYVLTANGGTIQNAAGTAFNISDTSLGVNYSGNIIQANNASAVAITNHSLTGIGLVTFSGSINATNGNGLQFSNADGSYLFTGGVGLNGGDAGIDIINDSDGSFFFGSSVAITNPSGKAFNVTGGSGSIQYSGTIAIVRSIFRTWLTVP